MTRLVAAGHLPDYACLIVGANMGLVGMCKEHMGVALALKVPVFFVVTKVDICPDHILKQTLQVSQTPAQCFTVPLFFIPCTASWRNAAAQAAAT